MNDGYRMTVDDMPPAEEAESKFPAEVLCLALTRKVHSDHADPRPATLSELWESPKIQEKLLGALAPPYRSRETLQGIQDQLEQHIYGRPIIAGSTVPTDDPDVRYVPVFDSLTVREGLDMVWDSDADLAVTVLRCADGQWRVAGFGDRPARPEFIPR